MRKNSYLLGVLLVFVGGVFWGLSGASAQYLFTYKHIDPVWLTTTRLLVAGIVLFLVEFARKKLRVFDIFKDKNSFLMLLIYAIFGLMFCQYTYFLAVMYSNSGIATVLQYLAPAIVISLIALKTRKLPKLTELLALVLATSGVFLLATHGRFSLFLPFHVLVAGLLSACCVVIYSMAPVRLNKRYGAITTLSYGLLIGGAAIAIFTKNLFDVTIDAETLYALVGVVFFGTMLAFGLYMLGLNTIGPARATLIASVEPVSSALFAKFWLGSEFISYDYIGFALILLCTFVVTKK